ncbi:hypothetical protein K431DRAFT_287177 [Polychaeton citri CBS 116435]|uniref:Uncharacterized protein n=1 Tax=Polychaeton citri CBS 116435 TaxID=1314669 RepID=A0A9P4Q6P0_9PEZI|nr:hypothetical protein K431DRAFT_287177 [Polychaeton citri CBS 116435]
MTESITHIVLFKYRPDITWAEFETHFEGFQALKTECLRNGKPYMKSMRMGKNRSWEPFHKGMTHGFVLEFESQDDLDYYLLEDEVHREFSRSAAPLVQDSVVVDIRDGVLFGPAAKRPLPQDSFKGSCHCGQMEWAAKLQKIEHVLCHCSTCQKLGGGPYSCNQIIPQEDLSITKGSPRVYTYKGASGKDVRCFFCGNCTSHIYHHQDAMPDKVIVRTLLLDGGQQMPATGEIFAEGRLSWVQDLHANLTPASSTTS